jgi:hypothetical protein
MHRHSVMFGDSGMQPATPRPSGILPTDTAEKFPPLEQVTRSHVSTEQAAYYLNRRPQTLREWAMTGKVIQPHRINGRLAWPVAAIRAVLGVSK